jgi:hypothetical protein
MRPGQAVEALECCVQRLGVYREGVQLYRPGLSHFVTGEAEAFPLSGSLAKRECCDSMGEFGTQK